MCSTSAASAWRRGRESTRRLPLPIHRPMEETTLDELREELAVLEAEEARLTAVRRRLHDQIDFGFASEGTRAREREISNERRELHDRINALRELLGTKSIG